VKVGELIDYGREKKWLNFRSDLEHILPVVIWCEKWKTSYGTVW